MANIGNIAKISVEKHDSKEQFLYDLDKSKSLCEVIRDICKNSGLPQSTVYGLKLIRTNNDPAISSYICENNYKNVQHTDCLKIVFSIKYLLKNRILPHINNEPSDIERVICYDDLTKLAADPAFIEELVYSKNHYRLIQTFIADDSLNDIEIRALLLTICHLLRKNYVVDTKQDFLDKTIQIIKKNENHTEPPPDYVQYALSVLQKILVQRDMTFHEWKEKIIKKVPVTTLIPYIQYKNTKNLQYTVLLLINTIIKLCRGDQKKHIIKEMNLNKNREQIYKFIIEQGNLDKNMEHELYVIQTYLMSLHEEALKKEVHLNDESAFEKEEFELPEEDIKRLTLLMDFDEMDLPNRSNSLETLLSHDTNERLSLVSLMSDKSIQSRSSVRSSRASSDMGYDNFTMNYLTLDALRHFKNNHKKNFLQSQIEEKVYEPGIFITSERVVRMLADMLDIGVDPPDPKSVFYHPIVFTTSPRKPFFLELFSRSMWLLSRTRREMKVSTIEDYPKVMQVLRKQIKMVLDTKPKDIKQLTNEMKETTFDTVLQQWQNENDEKMSDLLKNNKDIEMLKTKYALENDQYVRENRLNKLKAGEYFPKISEKFQKTNRQIFVQLSKNERELNLFDVIDKKKGELEKMESLKVADITHIAVGMNCRHSNLSKFPALVFSIIFNHSEKQVNFIAQDQKTASCWIDGFNILAGYSKRSDYYNKELDVLVEMDVRLQIIELQNIPLPNTAPPPIPPLPKPLVPPRPPALANRRKNTRINKRAM